jgi:hypothetical protein
MKPFKTSSKPILKNVIVSWYGEITLKILKVKAHLDTSIMYTWGAKNLRNQKKNHFKRTFENKVQF